MDKSWMQLPNRFWPEYISGIKEFIKIASGYTDSQNRTRCPCNSCNNRIYKNINVVKDHLFDNGMDKTYTRWVHHGEEFEMTTNGEDDENDDECGEGEFFDGMEPMLEDLCSSHHNDDTILDKEHMEYQDDYTADATDWEANPNGDSRKGDGDHETFVKLLAEARQPLYPGCEKFSKLDFLVKLLHIKTINHWSNKSFDMILELIKTALPLGESLPKSHYEAKTLMRNLGLGYIPIHACKHDCVLFWKETADLDSCPECGESRYRSSESKGKKIPHKVLRYFPLKPRLQRLFMSRMTAVDMRWHKEKRAQEENTLRHPADSKLWKEFDKEHEWFANDARNVRLGLASDGFNPFGNMSNSYSMWPVMLMPYNLPPWKCMKEPFIFMSLLIPGPKSPGNDIDVYLRPLVDELRELWENGVETYDSVTKKTFQLHASVLWTINDFPAYGNLSGWSTKGKLACPVCNKETCSMYLKNGQKLSFMGTRRFLSVNNSWRNRRKHLFDGKQESRLPPKRLSGDDLLSQLRLIEPQKFGKPPTKKKRKRPDIELNWTKKSIFFELPYWRTLKLRHNLDVMHIEKNICDNVLGTIMKLDGKTKDTIKARMDLEAMGIRKELHLIPRGDKFIIPPACYTLSLAERKSFCEWLKLVKFPDGYASNISRCVNVKDHKILGLKSHDCHVLLQRLLPVALRGFLPSYVSTALIELGLFFKELCSKTLKLDVLEKMEKDIVVILCKLEQIFPPAFFDIMVHLAIHLPYEAMLAGPVQYRWMFPIERFLHTLKNWARNKARPEGSIAEAYIDSECLTFCSMYLKGIETRFTREERNYDNGNLNHRKGLNVFTQNVRLMGKYKNVTLGLKELEKARFYVLNNSEEISEYFDQHIGELERQNPRNAIERHEKTFVKWFEQRMQALRDEMSVEATDEVYSLACGPDPRVKRYSGCIVNGIRFHTKDRERHLRTQNSGLYVTGSHLSKEIDFYGVLTDILELDYLYGNQVYLFKCDWWDIGNNKLGIQTDNHFTSVNVSRTWYKDDHFVLATQARQVFYLSDPKLRNSWQVVQKIKPRNVFDILELETREDNGDEAYQEEEQLAVNGIVRLEQTLHTSTNGVQVEEAKRLILNREDMRPDEVDASVIQPLIERSQMDANLVADDDTEDEDDTLMDYFTEQEDTILGDDDTDIEHEDTILSDDDIDID